ncbi:nucleic acid-binding protein [Ramicandelaber brevisporus]|nr:nucleic acid-binding protein [Ramicandelaber brevisporus]
MFRQFASITKRAPAVSAAVQSSRNWFSLNKATIIGVVGKTPELKHFRKTLDDGESALGTAYTDISVATNTNRKNRSTGEWTRDTVWHKVRLFGELAEQVAQSYPKGTRVYVEGPIQTDSWQREDGTTASSTYIRGLQVRLVEKAKEQSIEGGEDIEPHQTGF